MIIQNCFIQQKQIHQINISKVNDNMCIIATAKYYFQFSNNKCVQIQIFYNFQNLLVSFQQGVTLIKINIHMTAKQIKLQIKTQLSLMNCFPIQFKKRNIDTPCPNYMSTLLNYIFDINQHQHVLAAEQLASLQSLPIILKEYSYCFYPDYISLIVLRKKKQFMKTMLGVIFLKQNDVKATTGYDDYFYFADSPQSYGYYEIGEIQQNKSLSIQLKQLSNKLNYIATQNDQMIKIQKSPQTFKMFVMQAYQLKQIPKDQNIKVKKKAEQLLDLNNYEEGTSNVNKTVYPRKKQFLCWALLSHIKKDKELALVTLFSFKMNSLLVATKQINASNVQNSTIKAIKQISANMLIEYKQLYNKNIIIDHAILKKLFKQLSDNIQSLILAKNSCQSPKTIKLELAKSIQQQQRQMKPQSINQILDFTHFNVSHVNSNSNRGFTDSIRVNEAEPFTELMQMFKTRELTLGGQYRWILMVQNTLFQLSHSLKNKQVLSKIQIMECSLSNNQNYFDGNKYCPIHQVINEYESIMINSFKNKNYGMKLKNQSICHVYLIKYIAAAVCFQRVKIHFQKYAYNINKYRINISTLQLYPVFKSLCYQARIALQNLVKYTQQNLLKPSLFSFPDQKKSYDQLACLYFDNSVKLQSLLKQKMAKLDLSKRQISTMLQNFKTQVIRLQDKIRQTQQANCTCKYQDKQYQEHTYFGRYQTVIRKQKVKCKRCINLDSYKNQFQSKKQQTFYLIHSPLPANQANQKIQIFFQNTNLVLLYLCKISYQVQIPIIKKQAFCNYNKNILPTFAPLYPYSQQKSKVSRNKYQSMNKSIEQFIIHAHPLIIYYYNYTTQIPIDKQLPLPQKMEVFKNFQWMVNEPDNKDLTREHHIYANLQKKKESQQLKRLTLQEFIQYGSVRVGKRTQLPMICQSILKRQISPNILKNHELQRLIIFNTISDAIGFKYLQQIKNQKVLEEEPNSIISESIFDMLNNFTQEWRFQDLSSLQILGIIFSMLSKLIGEEVCTIKIIKKAFDQYTKYKQQTENELTNQVRLRQLFMLHSIFSCFSENLCENNKEASIIFAKIIINFRLHKRLILNKQNLNSGYVKMINQYNVFFDRAVFKNIHSVVDYFVQNSEQLTQVVAEVDKDVSVLTEWTYLEDEQYIFKGKSNQNEYILNLFEGILLKNGSESSCLPPLVRQNPQYIQIFGKTADLQVMKKKTGGIRTRMDYSKFFTSQKQSNIFFQFCFKNNKMTPQNVAIKMIVKRSDQQQSFLLIPQQTIKKCSLYIPQIYINQYYCWCDQKSYNLFFRRKKLKNMSEIGLVFMAQSDKNQQTGKNQLKIKQGRIITKQFDREPISYLSDPEHSKFFQKLFITSRQLRINAAIKILSTIQLPQYIIQTYSNDQTPQIVFWLHRCNNKFVFSQKKGLVSLSYQGYAIAEEYAHHQLFPWGSKSSAKCLVLEKFEHSYRTTQMHRFMFLTPNQTINNNGNILLPKDDKIFNELLAYQIHDNFLDIRSKSRVSQLHMASIIASVELQYRFKPLMLTHEQYCIDLIRSCYSNIPLSNIELAKILNIFSLSMSQNMNTLTLICQVLYRLSISLLNILPFKQQISNQNILEIQFSNNKHILDICKFIYRSNYKDDKISIHQKLNQLEMNMLGIDQEIIDQISKNIAKSAWVQKEIINIQIDDKTINSLNSTHQSFQKTQKDIEHLQTIIFQFFQKKDKDENTPSENQKILNFELQDKMSEQMFQDLKNSYKSFIRYNDKYQKLQLTKLDVIKKMKDYFILPKQKCQKFRASLQKQLNKINSINQHHMDVLHGSKTLFTQKHYTQILCIDSKLYQFYPKINNKNYQIIKEAIKNWMTLTLQIQSLHRLLLILDDSPIDKIALFRELQSPRKQINQKNHWICFETEMKIRVWVSQFDTYKHLINSKSGSVSQLNMGEGKTQVIIPLIVLDNIYGKKDLQFISRINILTSLFQQAQSNYFRFFSVTSFRIPCFSFYFNRDCEIDEQVVKSIKSIMYYFKNKMLMLIDRESCLSMILKERQLVLSQVFDKMGEKRDDWLFEQYPMFDIFDEVDALMTAKKSFVYSIGQSEQLKQNRIRYEVARVLIQIICKEMLPWLNKKQMLILQQSFQHAQETVSDGCYPKGIRLNSDLSRQKIMKFRVKLVTLFIEQKQYQLSQFKFYDSMSKHNKQILIKYLTNQEFSANSIDNMIDRLPEDISQILATRGLVAYGILQHSLTMRNGVDFGVPGQGHPKRVGVPYEAADVPSKRSEYAQPDVAIILAYISYYNKGLTYENFYQALQHLLSKVESVKQKYYNQWIQAIKTEDKRPLDVMSAKQINIDSQPQLQYLHKKFEFCRATINYWLVFCVFENDLRQYSQAITSSSWDIANVQKSIGFSGTKDTRWLNPNSLTLEPSQNDAINGTDGKMIFLMIHHTIDIITIKESNNYLWQRFCQNVLQLQDQNVGCIIDAGAILAGKSLQKQIVVWIAKHPNFNKNKYRGITFCDQNGKWKVYDIVTLSIVERGTSIPEHDTFVIFDQARTRGADIKMKTNIRAVLSLSSTMTKDKLMQAVGRLRKFGRCQELYIMGTQKIFKKIDGIDSSIKTEQIRNLIDWSCKNSLKQNRTMIYPNSKLAMIHYRTKLMKAPDIQISDTCLKSLYSQNIKEETAFNLFSTIILKQNIKIRESNEIGVMKQKMIAYGSKSTIKTSSINDVCQRQVQAVQQLQKNQQIQHSPLVPIQQNDLITKYQGNISTLAFKFDQNLYFSNNFIKCTKPNRSSLFFFGNEMPSRADNILCNVNFVHIKNNQLMIISQRQMNLLINKNVKCYGFYSLNDLENDQNQFVVRFQDLRQGIKIIQKKKLQASLVHAQYFNGAQNYEQTTSELLFQLLKNNYVSLLKMKPESSKQIIQPKSIGLFGSIQVQNKNISLQQLVSHFLIMRRTVQFKFISSDLQKIMIQISNIPKKQLAQ